VCLVGFVRCEAAAVGRRYAHQCWVTLLETRSMTQLLDTRRAMRLLLLLLLISAEGWHHAEVTLPWIVVMGSGGASGPLDSGRENHVGEPSALAGAREPSPRPTYR
jgi:hypothetical protein